MNILYKITYLPHLQNKTPPYYYIGSKFNYTGEYYGSPASKQKDWYTGDMTIAQWWSKETSNHPELFKFEILQTFDNISTSQLVEEEKKIQIEQDVRDSVEYFNKSIATSGWVSSPRTQETKNYISKVTKQFWESDEGKEKKKRLIERNKRVKSQEMKDKWKNPSEAMKNRLVSGRPKGTKDKNPRKQRLQMKVEIEGVLYNSAKDASNVYGITPTSVRRKCRIEKYTNWRYVL